MADRSALEAAAAAGVINAEQVGPLHDFLASRAAGVKPAAAGEEDLRFIRNFHDVFLAIGIVLFAVGLIVGIGAYASGAASPQQGAVSTGALAAGAAVIMWLLARSVRTPAPAVPAGHRHCHCVHGVCCGCGGVALFRRPDWPRGEHRGRHSRRRAAGSPQRHSAGGRVRVPGARRRSTRASACRSRSALPAAALRSSSLSPPPCLRSSRRVRLLPALYLGLGAVLFLAGVAFDARDPARTTRFSDNGFWLHFAAAPLILNGAFGLLARAFGGGEAGVLGGSSGLLLASGEGSAVGQAAATLAVVALLGFVSLLDQSSRAHRLGADHDGRRHRHHHERVRHGRRRLGGGDADHAWRLRADPRRGLAHGAARAARMGEARRPLGAHLPAGGAGRGVARRAVSVIDRSPFTGASGAPKSWPA